LIAAGESVWYQSTSWRICGSGTRQTRAASATDTVRARAMYSSNPRTWRSMKARSRAPRRSSSAVTAQARTTSVPGRRARWRSACSAIFVRRGSMTTSFAPFRRAWLMTGVKWRLQ
jgi:hypothetical protein